MASYDRTRWKRRKQDLTNKENPELRAFLYRAGITFEQLGAWVGVTPTTISLWLAKPLTDERRHRIEVAISSITNQREEVKG